ncbi:crosslink repair DNA glycosylase YcaQ family protein [Amaricoccus sp.]|uniref:DNA glycosylase AlkZ-like family protein n=1 Tax=Amaricoccus sp. TaxID=1872485 RepID=UPI001B68E418|nr:crosslink repair DNA glycosylase YcaQ family protein [Amaricoccus sp.]MBP7241384.1 AlkZ family DNA glycosylase [Amaricoccus sp.]
MARKPRPMTLAEARRRAIAAQRLDAAAPFGAGPDAVRAAVEHLGYVQIDTINVIERSHHHILWSRIPAYRRADLAAALSAERTVFEYWAHALAYIPTRDLRFFLPAMAAHKAAPHRWFGSVSPAELRAIVARVRREGPLSIRDIDEERVAKDHLWASRKPSKRALELAFFAGLLTVSARAGMVKTYELPERHFGWDRRPRPASDRQILDYLLDRALRAQGVVALDSICYMDAPRKPAMAELIEARVRRRRLLPVALDGTAKPHWITPEAAAAPLPEDGPVHLLSPFDPLVIQRKRLAQLFAHDHRFEAYVPAAKRVLGYFALPVLVGDRIAAAIDAKADRAAGKLLVQKWTWLDGPRDGDKAAIEEALERFVAFQLGD